MRFLMAYHERNKEKAERSDGEREREKSEMG
jgi:hypothetical protein